MPAKKISRLKKIACFLMIVSFLCLARPTASKAAFWPGIDPPIQRMLDTIFEMIQGIIMGALKQEAATTLNNMMSSMIGSGRGGQAMFITDWQDYLVTQPTNQTLNYMNDYVSQMTKGRGSLGGYSAEGFMGNYMPSMNSGAMGVLDQSPPKVTMEMDPSQMFSAGNFKGFNQYLSGVNNPWAFNQAVEAEYRRKLEEEKNKAAVKAGAGQGFLGQEDAKGNTTYPGSLAMQNMANVQDIGNKIIADADQIPEVIVAIVSQMISRAMQQGFTEVKTKLNTESNQSNQKMMNSIKTSGPGGQF